MRVVDRLHMNQINHHDFRTDLKYYTEPKAFVDRSYIFYRDMNTLQSEIKKKIFFISDHFILHNS